MGSPECVSGSAFAFHASRRRRIRRTVVISKKKIFMKNKPTAHNKNEIQISESSRTFFQFDDEVVWWYGGLVVWCGYVVWLCGVVELWENMSCVWIGQFIEAKPSLLRLWLRNGSFCCDIHPDTQSFACQAKKVLEPAMKCTQIYVQIPHHTRVAGVSQGSGLWQHRQFLFWRTTKPF